MAYYNTTNLSGEALTLAVQAARTQFDAVRLIYQDRPALSPSEAQAILEKLGKKWPLTSVRRAISDLTDAGLLRKTTMYATGPYGSREHIWQRVKSTTAQGAEL